jgi:hypothetical protein
MRKIYLEPINNSKWNRWCSDCKKATEECVNAHERGENPGITDLYKRKSIKKEYFFNREAPFFGKCAYCETYITDFQHGDVEHFRPKAGITDENDNPVYLKNNDGTAKKDGAGNSVPHPGYYWLAYDWTNLLPSCIKCNEADVINNQKIGKHMRFPVKGVHAQKPEELPGEQPFLINPASTLEADDPENHLQINTDTGLLEPLTERGEMCIKIFGLNLREQLVKDRLRACHEIQNLIFKIITNPGRSDEIKSEISAIKEGKRAYTSASLAALKEMRTLLSDL